METEMKPIKVIVSVTTEDGELLERETIATFAEIPSRGCYVETARAVMALVQSKFETAE